MAKEPLRIRLDLKDLEAGRFLRIKDYLGVKNDTEVVRAVINWFWRDHEKELQPPLKHFNLNEEGVLILDHSLDSPRGRIIQVFFKPDGPECEFCESKRCRHIEFALSLPEVQKILQDKGWESS